MYDFSTDDGANYDTGLNGTTSGTRYGFLPLQMTYRRLSVTWSKLPAAVSAQPQYGISVALGDAVGDQWRGVLWPLLGHDVAVLG